MKFIGTKELETERYYLEKQQLMMPKKHLKNGVVKAK